jgi:hypothetical protein
MGDKRKMSEVEQLAQEQFNTFKNRLCEILSEIEEEYKSVFIQGYAKGETDEKFRTKQVVTRHIAELEKENAELKKKVENLQKYLDTRNCYRECAETWQKLTEAKKLLKQFLEVKNSEDTYKAEWEAEQFLKSSEVEK